MLLSPQKRNTCPLDRTQFNNLEVREEKGGNIKENIRVENVPQFEPGDDEELVEDFEQNEYEHDSTMDPYEIQGIILSSDPEWEEVIYPSYEDEQDLLCVVSCITFIYIMRRATLNFQL